MKLPPDFRDLLAEFADEQVEYVLVGGYAVGYHSKPRATKDLDVLLVGTPENLERAARALARYGAASNPRKHGYAARLSPRATGRSSSRAGNGHEIRVAVIPLDELDTDGSIQSCDVTGASPTTIASSQYDGIYWTEAGTDPDRLDGRVRRANLDGTNPVVLASPIPEPSSIAIDANAVYVSVRGTLGAQYRDGQILKVAKS